MGSGSSLFSHAKPTEQITAAAQNNVALKTELNALKSFLSEVKAENSAMQTALNTVFQTEDVVNATKHVDINHQVCCSWFLLKYFCCIFLSSTIYLSIYFIRTSLAYPCFLYLLFVCARENSVKKLLQKYPIPCFRQKILSTQPNKSTSTSKFVGCSWFLLKFFVIFHNLFARLFTTSPGSQQIIIFIIPHHSSPPFCTCCLFVLEKIRPNNSCKSTQWIAEHQPIELF